MDGNNVSLSSSSPMFKRVSPYRKPENSQPKFNLPSSQGGGFLQDKSEPAIINPPKKIAPSPAPIPASNPEPVPNDYAPN